MILNVSISLCPDLKPDGVRWKFDSREVINKGMGQQPYRAEVRNGK
jgi:hypothetical protein